MMGIDYGLPDENPPPDFHAARAGGARFVYIRKSDCWYDPGHQAHHLRPDPVYARDAQAARDAGLVVGAYLFPSFRDGAPAPEDQVANFEHAAGDIRPGVDLPPCFDLEFPGRGIQDTGRSQEECLKLAQRFVEALAKTYSCRPVVYTSHVEWHDDNGLGGPEAPWIASCPLWIKTGYRLKPRQPLDQVLPPEPHPLPSPWANSGWWLHQFQGDCLGFPGVSKTVDVNRFNVASHATQNDPRLVQMQRWVGCAPDGSWGPRTEDAVQAFQARRGLVADGVFGVASFAAAAWQ